MGVWTWNFRPVPPVASVTYRSPGVMEQVVSSVAEQQAEAAREPSPAQRFGTDGIKPLARASLVTRQFMRVVAFVERLNLSYSKVGNPPIYDNAVFPWTKQIERDWRA